MKSRSSTDSTANYQIRTEGLEAIDTLLLELGQDPQMVFAESNLDIDLLLPENKDRQLPYAEFLKFLNYCAKVSGRPDFGALLSRYQDMSVIGLPGQAMREAPTFRAALANLIDFFHLHLNGMQVVFEEYDALGLIKLQVVMPFSPDYRQQVELSLGIGVRFIRRLLGTDWSPEQAYFEHSADSGSATTERLFRCPVSYRQEFNGYTFNAAQLDIQRSDFNSESHQILYDYLCLLTRRTRRDLIIETREHIIHALQQGDCHIDRVSERMSLQRRTLQRQLAARGVQYRDLLEQIRTELAQRYLRNTGVPVTQIADMLCYSDISGFSRSFRRIFAVSPRRWRQQQSNGSNKVNEL